MQHGTTDLPEGTIFDDAPEHASLEKLAELTGNHDTKLGKQRCAIWGGERGGPVAGRRRRDGRHQGQHARGERGSAPEELGPDLFGIPPTAEMAEIRFFFKEYSRKIAIRQKHKFRYP
jgi:hypothetical protein